MQSKCCLLVTSCDEYCDLWPGFFYQLEKNLNLPLKRYLLSNNIRFEDEKKYKVNTLQVGSYTNWTSNLRKALELIQEEYIFIIVEDFYICEPVNLSLTLNVINFAVEKNVQHIKFSPDGGSNSSYNELFLSYEKKMPYWISLCGIWNKAYLKSILLDGESAWLFEINSNYRVQYSAEKLLALKKPLFKYKNMVQKGLWIKESLKWAIKLNVPINPTVRPIQKNCNFYFKTFFFKIIFLIPWKIRLSLLDFFRKLLACY
jgi:hypothetical protein